MRVLLGAFLLVVCLTCLVSPGGAQPAEQEQGAGGADEPALTPAEAEAAQRLQSLLPSAAALDQQLQALRDEHIVAQFQAGLRALRYGYAKGNRSYMGIAAARFRGVTNLAPQLAAGYLYLGLTYFYLNDFSAAQPAFAEAVRLDKSLWPSVPLIWWENFPQLPTRDRLAGGAATADPAFWWWEILPDAGLHFVSERPTGLIVWQPPIAPELQATNSHVAIRFRCANGGRLSIGCRQPSGGAVIFGVGAAAASVSFFPTHDRCEDIGQAPMKLLEGWHLAELDVYGTATQACVDGVPVFERTVPRAGPGISSFTLWGPGEVIVDWILVTRN
ncbi:MAG: hypothetical protein KKI08_13685 [Armatimonadetes bacterium]|nr:hypothetical protein [Armatimonadota bacterium]